MEKFCEKFHSTSQVPSLSSSFSYPLVSSYIFACALLAASTCLRLTFTRIPFFFFLLRPFLEGKEVKCDEERNSSKGESVSLHRVIFEIPRRPRDSLAFFPFSRLFYFSLRLCSSYSIPRASPSFLSSSRVVSLDGIPVSSVKRACDEGFPLFRSPRHPGTKKEGQ